MAHRLKQKLAQAQGPIFLMDSDHQRPALQLHIRAGHCYFIH